MLSLASSMSLISMAWLWCGIINEANLTSASLCDPAAGALDPEGAAAEVDGAAEAELLEPWSMPGLFDMSLSAQPDRPVSAAAAAAARPSSTARGCWS